MLTEYQRYRLYEILPGVSVWMTLIVSIALSFIAPVWMIYFIIIFDIYWVLKVANFVFYLSVAWFRFTKTKKINWKDVLIHEIADQKKYKHVIFLTLYDESWDVVEQAIESVKNACYNKNNFVLVIAGEARKKENYKKIFAQITNQYGTDFKDIVGTLHPADLPDEIPGKGSNLHYAEGVMKTYIDKKKWNYDEIIVTIFDIDTVCHEQYFAYLTHQYALNPDRTHSSYQPIALYNNNMWESQSLLRIMAFGTTFWTFTSLARQDAAVTFSSHSMSFRALVDAGFHDKRIVSEDSRIFYQCYLAYNGNYRLTPLYLPISMHTVHDESWWKSIKNLYKQQRRWAWGAEHIPYLIIEFSKKKKEISLFKRLKWVYLEWEGKWSWCTVALIITFIGRLPMWVAPESVRQSALFFNAPHILEVLMTMAMAGLLMSAVLSFPLLPPRPKTHQRRTYIIMLLQWALLPVSLIFLSAIPAIDALTHMMFGKYLGFNVSQKKSTTSHT